MVGSRIRASAGVLLVTMVASLLGIVVAAAPASAQTTPILRAVPNPAPRDADGRSGVALELRGWPANVTVNITVTPLGGACPFALGGAGVATDNLGNANRRLTFGPGCSASSVQITANQAAPGTASAQTTVTFRNPTSDNVPSVQVHPTSQVIASSGGGFGTSVAGVLEITDWVPNTAVTITANFGPCTGATAIVPPSGTATDNNGDLIATFAATNCDPNGGPITFTVSQPGSGIAPRVATFQALPPAPDTGTQQPGVEGPQGNESCSNGIDDDNDGLIDANDPNCQAPATGTLSGTVTRPGSGFACLFAGLNFGGGLFGGLFGGGLFGGTCQPTGVSGATVTAGGQTTTTDASGNYSLTLPAGTHTANATVQQSSSSFFGGGGTTTVACEPENASVTVTAGGVTDRDFVCPGAGGGLFGLFNFGGLFAGPGFAGLFGGGF